MSNPCIKKNEKLSINVLLLLLLLNIVPPFYSRYITRNIIYNRNANSHCYFYIQNKSSMNTNVLLTFDIFIYSFLLKTLENERWPLSQSSRQKTLPGR